MSTDSVVSFASDYRDLLCEFVDAKVEFLLIGGWAMALHGHGRSTDDIDILVKTSDENSGKVYEALVNFGAPLAAHQIDRHYFEKMGACYRIGRKPLLIEILTAISGINYTEAREEAPSFRLGSRTISYIGRASLLKNKLAAARKKDLADADWLLKHPPQ